MSLLLFSALVFAGSFAAGTVGALTGLGGGVILIPLLTLGFHVDLRYAIGASLISVIATSSGAAAAYVRDGYTNVRIGMFLEVATTVGAVCGALLAGRLPLAWLAFIFGVVLIYTAFVSWRKQACDVLTGPVSPWSAKLRLGGSYPNNQGGATHYEVDRISGGFVTMFGAGALSGLLGIGSGAVKVLAMDRIMRIPFKVSTTTSNFMIGVTAAASAGIYFRRGYIDALLVAPVMLGVLAGSMLGAKLLDRMHVEKLRIIFYFVIFILGIEMIFNAVRGRV